MSPENFRIPRRNGKRKKTETDLSFADTLRVMLEDLKSKLRTAYIEKVKGECVFCKMIEEENQKIIYQNDLIAVFPPLKSGALKEGHLLVVPRKHSEDIFEMEGSEAEEYFGQIKDIADKLKEKSRYSGVNILSANGKEAQQSIRHMHTHLILRENDDGYDMWPKTSYKGQSFKEVNKELSNLIKD